MGFYHLDSWHYFNIENIMLSWRASWCYALVTKCYVTCGHTVFMTWRSPLNNSDIHHMINLIIIKTLEFLALQTAMPSSEYCNVYIWRSMHGDTCIHVNVGCSCICLCAYCSFMLACSLTFIYSLIYLSSFTSYRLWRTSDGVRYTSAKGG